jgi:hypothetical protein
MKDTATVEFSLHVILASESASWRRTRPESIWQTGERSDSGVSGCAGFPRMTENNK